MSRRGSCVDAFPIGRSWCGSAQRAKNQLHATLIRNLKGKPPVSDLFGVRGRRWLAEQVLPADEQETVAACLRQEPDLEGTRRSEALERPAWPLSGVSSGEPGPPSLSDPCRGHARVRRRST
jgi:hypothetical protein